MLYPASPGFHKICICDAQDKTTDLRLPWFYMGYLRFLNII